MNKYLLLLIIISVATGCEKDRLKDNLNSPLDENSGVEIFTVDSIKIFPSGSTNRSVYCYFRMDNSLIKNPALLNKIVSYRNGELRNRWNLNSTYFFDFSGVIGNTYTYNLALEDIYGYPSKLSKPIVVTIQ